MAENKASDGQTCHKCLCGVFFATIEAARAHDCGSVPAACPKAAKSIVWYGKHKMEMTHTETQSGNKCIIYDGFKYRKRDVSQKTGNTYYICSSLNNCYASIIIDGDGKKVVKLNTNHTKLCREKYAKRQSHLQVLAACSKATKSIIWYGKHAMEITHTETQSGNKCIIYKGFRYRKRDVSQKTGNTYYVCSSLKNCYASILIDGDGKKVVKLNTYHNKSCCERNARRSQLLAPTTGQLQQTESSIIWNGEHAMEITYDKNKRGTPILIYDGSTYRLVNVSQNGNKTYRCSIGNSCNAFIILDAGGENVVNLRPTHSEKCNKRRTITLTKQRRTITLTKQRRTITLTKQHSQRRNLFNTRHCSKTLRANAPKRTPAAASRAPVSVTPVSAPSVVPRQHEDDEIPMVTGTFYPAMPAPQVVIETKEEVSSTTMEEPVEQENNPADGISGEMCNLDAFEEQQNRIQEANKEREMMLAKTLFERQKKAKEEAQKLSQIQEELVKLDNSLAADVALMREEMQIASTEFVQAQKQYNKAEREFNDAKLDLQQISELQEQLTEHLKSAIQQNEVHKACKLQEFMSELEIESPSSSSEATPLNSLPPQSSFGIHDVNTFHSPLISPESSTSSSTSRLPFTPFSQSINEPASSLLQSASSGTKQLSIVPQLTYSDPQPSSSVLEPDSSVLYPVSLSVAPQVAIRQEYHGAVNRMDTSSPISIHSDTSSVEVIDLDTYP